MAEKTLSEQIGEETLRHMRGKYSLDELGDGKDELKFRKSGKTILTVYIRDGYYDFMIIFGRLEREKFETMRADFSSEVQAVYDASTTYHDGKWMMFPVRDLDMLEEMKRLLLIKKRPNRKPFPKENAIYARCGARCDLCLLYEKNIEKDDRRTEFSERSVRIFGDQTDYSATRCPGCLNKQMDEDCDVIRCLVQKGYGRCARCESHPCDRAPLLYGRIEPRSMTADDITIMVLPYVLAQYGN